MLTTYWRKPALVALILFASAVLPISAWGTGYTVYVPSPNGVSDTVNLQGALDSCVAYGRGCTVQLAAGTYLTSQLVAYNFHGNFRGMGKTKTTIQALPQLDVTGFPLRPNFEFFECKPNTTDCAWPTLILFVDGDIHISDLAIEINTVPATKSWFINDWELTVLLDAMRITGQSTTNASIADLHLGYAGEQRFWI